MTEMAAYWRNYIGGEWVDGGAGRMEVVNPGTGAVLAEQALADAADVDRAVAAARACVERGTLRDMRPLERGRLVQAMAAHVRAQAEDIATVLTLEQGKPLWEARAEVEKVIVSLKDRVDRLVVSTPVPGIVQSLPLQANAGVLPPGGVVAEIVPVDDGFIVESRVQTRDIGFLEVGQPVTVKIDAFDYARYGSIPGRLTELSPTTFLDEQNRPYYQAKIEIEKIYVGPNPQENAVMPGMTVQGDIATGDRTVLQYLLKPLYTVVNEAFWER